MKTCKNCNTALNDDVKFCPTCGAEQEMNPPQAQPFAGAQPEMPNASQPAGVNSNVYFTPGADTQPAAFNGGAAVENVAAPKKKKGGKIVLAVIAAVIIIGIVFAVKSFSGGDKIEAGVADADGYTNSSVDLRVNCPDGWTMFTGNELAVKTNGVVGADGKVTDANGGFYECMFATDMGENIIVSTIEGNFADAITTEEEFINDMSDSFSQSGGTVGQPYTLQIGGNTYSCIDSVSTVQGVSVQQTMCVVKEGSQYFILLFTLFPDYGENNVQSLVENYFTEAN